MESPWHRPLAGPSNRGAAVQVDKLSYNAVEYYNFLQQYAHLIGVPHPYLLTPTQELHLLARFYAGIELATLLLYNPALVHVDTFMAAFKAGRDVHLHVPRPAGEAAHNTATYTNPCLAPLRLPGGAGLDTWLRTLYAT